MLKIVFVFGQNPNLPSNLNDDLPALSRIDYPKILRQNLNALHAAKKAYIASENDERLQRALPHNVRTSSEQSFSQGTRYSTRETTANCGTDRE